MVALAWPAIAPAGDPVGRRFYVAAASSYALIGIVGAVPAMTQGDSASHFAALLAGYAVVLAGIWVGARARKPAKT
jgi:hypothetical protein